MKETEKSPNPQPLEAVPEQSPEALLEEPVEPQAEPSAPGQAEAVAEEPSMERPGYDALREAYLRGRNEAIAEALGRDAEHPFVAPRNHTPGIRDPYTPPSDPALAAMFTFRQSVWQ